MPERDFIIASRADFLSYGLTRYCLRRGVQGNVGTAFKWGVVDLIGGFVIFVLLGIAIITYVHFVQTPDGPFMDIAGILAGLRTAPSEYYWMIFMFASTLVPTVLHVTVFILSSGYLIIPLLPFVIHGLKDRASLSHMVSGALPLCIFVILAVGLPIQVLYWLVTGVDYAVLLRLLSLFEGYARWIGGIPPL